MAVSQERIEELIELIYLTPGSPEAWRGLLSALRKEVSGETVGVLVGSPRVGRPGILVTDGVDEPVNPAEVLTKPRGNHSQWVREVPAGFVARITPGEAQQRFTSSTLYERMLEPHGIRSSTGLVAVIGRSERRAHTFLVLLSRDDWVPTDDDVALLRELSPHLVRAARLHERIIRGNVTADVLLGALDHLVLGVLLLDQSGRVAFANRSGADLLGAEAGIADPTVLGTGRDLRTRQLRNWIGREQGPRHGALVYPHPVDGRPLQVLTAPLSWSIRDGEAHHLFAVGVFIGDPTANSGDPVEILRELYRLTPAESRLAILLLADRSLDEAAKDLGITVGTARTTLKRIFSKTGTNRQASLVRLLLTGPGQLRSDD